MSLESSIKIIIDNVKKVIKGKENVIKLSLAAILSQGHILFEDVPGVGKTILSRSLAKSIDCSFNRIQFTPDLMPSDVTGVSIYNQKTNEFEFKEGPIISQVVLADEINRATPRTQSSLLESMAEQQLTIERNTIKLPEPFIVMATQNPIEYDGTFPLPVAQLDRFIIKTDIGYPDPEKEAEILLDQVYQHPINKLKPVISATDFVKLQQKIKDIYVKNDLYQYIIEIVNKTRSHNDISLGSSPRGSLGIYKMSRSWAAIEGRDYVIPDDVKKVAPQVLNHRIILKSDSRLRGNNKEDIISDILKQVKVPVEVG